MSTTTVSPELIENTRKKAEKIQTQILQALALKTQSFAADCMGSSDSTVSRQKEGLQQFCLLLAAVDLQVSPVDAVVVEQTEIKALERMAYKYLKAKVESGEVV